MGFPTVKSRHGKLCAGLNQIAFVFARRIRLALHTSLLQALDSNRFDNAALLFDDRHCLGRLDSENDLRCEIS